MKNQTNIGPMEGKTRLNLIGKKFNKLTVIRKSDREPHQSKNSYWECKCDCGSKKVVITTHDNLKRNLVKSCRCIQWAKHPPGQTRIRESFGNYKRKCKKQNMPFKLTFEQFKTLVLSNCFYCNKEPSNTQPSKVCRIKSKDAKRHIFIKLNGIDRIKSDRKIGYTIKNTVPCCRYCNSSKLDLKRECFFSWIEKTFYNLKSKGFVN